MGEELYLCMCLWKKVVDGRRWLIEARRREGGKVLYILADSSAKNVSLFYGEEIGFRVARTLKDLGPKQQFYSCVLLRAGVLKKSYGVTREGVS